MRALAWLPLIALMACRADASSDSATTCADDPSQPACGVRLDDCPLGVPLPGGGCEPVGVPIDGCGDAATSDARGGCTPRLPETACKSGLAAYPGETTCHVVTSCPEGRFGDAPTTALHVDGAATADPPDGSVDKPFRTISAALAAATTGSLIVVAAGSYAEDVSVGKRVELRGVCPEKVEVVGQSGDVESGAIRVRAPAKISGLSVRGPSHGIYAQGYEVELHHLWIHDVGGVGIGIEQRDVRDPSSVHDVLVERADIGLGFTSGAPTVERAEVRDSRSAGSFVRFGPGYLSPASATFRHVLFDRNVAPSVLVQSSALTLEDGTVRATLPDKGSAVGVGALDDKALPGASALTLRRTIVTGTMQMGVTMYPRKAGATFLLEDSTISDVRRDGDGFAAAIYAPTLAEARLVRTTLRDFEFSGAVTYGGKLTLDHALIANVKADQAFGVGITGFVDGASASPPALDVVASRIEHVRTGGIWLEGGPVHLSGSAIESVESHPEGLGDGVVVYSSQLDGVTWPAELLVENTRVVRAARASLSAFAATVTLHDSAFLCSAFDFELGQAYGGSGEAGAVNVVDAGGTRCGCDSFRRCKAQSSTLAPITPQPPRKPSL